MHIALIPFSLVAILSTREANAQALPPPQRDAGWQAVSTTSMLVAASEQLIMPRIYLSGSETTVGWKARYHASVLFSIGALAGLAALNEYVVHPNVTSYRPGCGPSNEGAAGCGSFGMPSTPTFVAFSAFGHGAAIFAVDTYKWNDWHIHPGAVVGDVALPLLASGLTIAGRVAGTPSIEHGDQAIVGAAFGFGFGLVAGLVYSYFQKPECGYGAGFICF